MKLSAFLFSIFICIAEFSFCQDANIRFTNFNAGNGLAENENRVIYQDSHGLIWIGTVNGLVRFDGSNFVTYKSDTDDTTSISNNTVKAIREDKNGQLWIGTEGGLNLYNDNLNSFRVFKNVPSDNTTLSSDNINSLKLDKKGNLWICSENGLNKLDYSTLKFTRFVKKSNEDLVLPGENVENVCDAGNGKLWVATNKGLGLFDPMKATSTNYDLDNLKIKNLSKCWIDDVLVDKKGRLWVGVSNGGLFRIDDPLNSIGKHFINQPENSKSLLDNDVYRIFEDSEGNIWVGSYEGLNLYEEKSESFIRFVHDDLNEYSISGRYVFSVFEDKQKNLWIPTKRGVSLYTTFQNQFKLIRNISNKSQASLSNEVRSIFQENPHELWIGYILNGLDLYKDGKLVKHFEHQSKNKNSLINNNVNCLLHENHDRIWIGTLDGVSLLNPGKNTFTNYIFDPENEKSLGNNRVFNIYKDSKNQIWFCTWGGGLNLFNETTNQFERYLTGDKYSEPDAYIKTILETRDHTLWIGNNDGLKIFNQKEGSLKYYRHNVVDKTSISGNYIQVIFEDSKGQLWIGTTTGLNRLVDKEKGIFQIYTEKNGLPSNIIYGILEDKKGRLWLSTSNGLSCLTHSEGIDKVSFRNYFKGDGIQGNQFNEGSFFEYEEGGEMYFGGTNGLTVFSADKVTNNPCKPDIFLSRLLFSNKEAKIGQPGSPLQVELNQSKELVLTNTQASTFTIEFSALNYINSENNQYAYMLEGFDKDWNFIGNIHSVTYTNLRQGDYSFKVKAANNHGVWNDNPRILKITILPPWWKTIWALIIYVFIINGILLLLRQYSLSQAKLKHSLLLEKLEKEKVIELNDLKLQFFTNISHEFKTPLTLILSPADELLKDESISAEGKKHLSIIHRNANRLYRLINQLLEFRRMESDNKEFLAAEKDIVKSIYEIKNAFEDYAKKYNITFTIKATMDSCFVWFDADKFEKILYNILSNAFKYTLENGQVTVSIDVISKYIATSSSLLSNNYRSTKIRDEKQEYVSISIMDSGIGFENTELIKILNQDYKGKVHQTPYILKETSTGIGLAYAKSLIELHKGFIEVISEKDKGTIFTIYLPLGNTHLLKEQRITSENSGSNTQEYIQISKFEEDSKVNLSKAKLTSADIHNKHKHLIIVVEDNSDVRNFIKDGLSNDYIVAEASNGEEGFELAVKIMPDLIITDVMMPKLNGLELCKKLKSDVKTSHIAVIILSAKSRIENEIEGLELGADDYLGKPFSLSLLKTRIKSIIELRRRMRDFYTTGIIDQAPSEFKLNKNDEDFLKKAFEILENYISDPDLDLDVFCDALKMSQMQVYRKLKSLVNQSTNEFIRNYRLDKAAKLLQKNELNISEIGYNVGFMDPLYFSRCFKKRFGVSPIYYHKKFD